MTATNSERDIVLFLGAGFSKAVGQPLMSEFGDMSREDFAALVRRHVIKGPLFEGLRRHAEDVATAAGFFEGFRQFATRASTFLDFDPNNLEDLFCLAEMLDEAHVEVTIDGERHEPAVVLKWIKEWLWNVYNKYHPNDRSFNSDESPYLELFEYFKSHELLARLNVLTTNYDLVFEIVSYKCEIQSSYPLDGVADSISLIENRQPYVSITESAGSPVICKLHGSVNYLSPTRRGGKVFIADRWERGGRLNQPEILFLDPSHELRRKTGIELVPELVPPTYAKLHQSPWLKQLWKYSIHALSSAERIIFIGYSFPQSDGFMRSMVRSAMALRDPQKPAPNVWVFDPSKDVIDEYRTLFGKLYDRNQLHCHQKPFSTDGKVTQQLLDALDKNDGTVDASEGR